MEKYMVVVGMVLISVIHVVESQVHHVVGGDRGWDRDSDLKSWSSNRLFRVGDNIWFTFSAAEEGISEVRSMEEFLSCDVSNPIKMYSDGLNKVGLHVEGIRYFVSSKPESCKQGLKLHVDVLPKHTPSIIMGSVTQALAAGPTPSAAVALSSGSILLLALVFYMSWI
ncbi:hypothetical protein ACHQM5_025609 [Ranunculus cassubicifolius]